MNCFSSPRPPPTSQNLLFTYGSQGTQGSEFTPGCEHADFWQYLETFLVMTAGGGANTGIWWTEARMLLTILQRTGQHPLPKSDLAPNASGF